MKLLQPEKERPRGLDGPRDPSQEWESVSGDGHEVC